MVVNLHFIVVWLIHTFNHPGGFLVNIVSTFDPVRSSIFLFFFAVLFGTCLYEHGSSSDN